jgi:hypothetical protein
MTRRILLIGHTSANKTSFAKLLQEKLIRQGIRTDYLGEDDLGKKYKEQTIKLNQHSDFTSSDIIIIDVDAPTVNARASLDALWSIYFKSEKTAKWFVEPLEHECMATLTDDGINDIDRIALQLELDYNTFREEELLNAKYLVDINKWVVLGPRRTGSTVTYKIVQNIYKRLGKTTKIYGDVHGQPFPITELKPFDVVHTHDVENLKLLDINTACIISIRDMVETTFSLAIMRTNSTAHIRSVYTNNNYIPVTEKVKPKISIDPDKFKEYYRHVLKFYNRINRNEIVAQHPNMLFIGYKDFSADINLLPPIMGFKLKSPLTNLVIPMKNPSYKDRIENYKELNKISEEFERDPFYFLG